MMGCGKERPSSDPDKVWICASENLHAVGNCFMVRVDKEGEAEYADTEMLANEVAHDTT